LTNPVGGANLLALTSSALTIPASPALAREREPAMQQIQTPIQALLNRPRNYNNIDGTGEISAGLILLGFLFAFWMQIHTALHSFWNRSFGSILCMLALCLALHYGMKAFKQKITFPRTGFVRYRAKSIWYVLATAGTTAATVVLISRNLRHLLDAASAIGFLYGFFLAVCYGYGIARSVPWKWRVASAIFLSGTVVALLPAAVLQTLVAGSSARNDLGFKLIVALFPYFLVWSTLLLLSGFISLVLYLRDTRASAPDAQ